MSIISGQRDAPGHRNSIFPPNATVRCHPRPSAILLSPRPLHLTHAISVRCVPQLPRPTISRFCDPRFALVFGPRHLPFLSSFILLLLAFCSQYLSDQNAALCGKAMTFPQSAVFLLASTSRVSGPSLHFSRFAFPDSRFLLLSFVPVQCGTGLSSYVHRRVFADSLLPVAPQCDRMFLSDI